MFTWGDWEGAVAFDGAGVGSSLRLLGCGVPWGLFGVGEEPAGVPVVSADDLARLSA